MSKYFKITLIAVTMLLALVFALSSCTKDEETISGEIIESGEETDLDETVDEVTEFQEKYNAEFPDNNIYLVYFSEKDAIDEIRAERSDSEYLTEYNYAELFADSMINEDFETLASLVSDEYVTVSTDTVSAELKNILYQTHNFSFPLALEKSGNDTDNILNRKFYDELTESVSYIVTFNVLNAGGSHNFSDGDNSKVLFVQPDEFLPGECRFYFANPNFIDKYNAYTYLPVKIRESIYVLDAGYSLTEGKHYVKDLKDSIADKVLEYLQYSLESEVVSLASVNEFLSSHFDGVSELNANDLKDKINTLYFDAEGIDYSLLDRNDDTALYGLAPHGELSYKCSVGDVEYGRYDTTVKINFYADAAKLIPVKTVTFTFDSESGDKLTGIEVEKLNDAEPYGVQF